MKKLVVLLLTLTLCFGAAFALAAEYTASALYTITYDDAVFTLDTSYADTSSEGERWLFSLTHDKMVVEGVQEPIQGEESLDLLTATPEALQEYIDGVYDYFADQCPELITTIKTTREGVPFYVFSLRDEEGTYYYAETMVKGMSLGFYAYYTDVDADDALLDALTQLLETYVPAAA